VEVDGSLISRESRRMKEKLNIGIEINAKRGEASDKN
jgi:hypothetical protein